MAFLSFISRVVLGVLAQQGVQDVFTSVGKYALRQATAALVNHVRNQTAIRKGPQTVK